MFNQQDKKKAHLKGTSFIKHTVAPEGPVKQFLVRIYLILARYSGNHLVFLLLHNKILTIGQHEVPNISTMKRCERLVET